MTAPSYIGGLGAPFDASENIMDDLEWHHIVITQSGTLGFPLEITLWVDNRKLQVLKLGFIASAVMDELVIGQNHLQGFKQDSSLAGQIQGLRIYPRAITTPEEINWLYSKDILSLELLRNYQYDYPIPSKQVASYLFDGQAGDSSGLGNYALSINGTAYTKGNVLHLGNDATSFLELPVEVLDNVNDFTIAFWGKIETLHDTPAPLSQLNTALSGARTGQDNAITLYYLGADPSVAVREWQIQIDGVPVAFTSTTNSMDDLAWHHIAIVRRGDQFEIWIDNVLTQTLTGPTTQIDLDSGKLYLGQEQDSLGGGFDADQSWAGKLEHFRIYNRALTTTQIDQLYRVPRHVDKLFYISGSSGANQAWIANKDGTSPEQVTFEAGGVQWFAVHPDGKRCAYILSNDLYEFSLLTRTHRQITNTGTTTSPVYSPDGTKLGFVSDRNGSNRIHWFIDGESDLEGDIPTRLDNATDLVERFDFSPNNYHIVFGKGSGVANIWQTDVFGTTLTQLTNNAHDTFNPRYSPDGNRIVYTYASDGAGVGVDKFEVWEKFPVNSAPGANETQLTNDPGGVLNGNGIYTRTDGGLYIHYQQWDTGLTNPRIRRMDAGTGANKTTILPSDGTPKGFPFELGVWTCE
jgi:hypothetical protein